MCKKLHIVIYTLSLFQAINTQAFRNFRGLKFKSVTAPRLEKNTGFKNIQKIESHEYKKDTEILQGSKLVKTEFSLEPKYIIKKLQINYGTQGWVGKNVPMILDKNIIWEGIGNFTTKHNIRLSSPQWDYFNSSKLNIFHDTYFWDTSYFVSDCIDCPAHQVCTVNSTKKITLFWETTDDSLSPQGWSTLVNHVHSVIPYGDSISSKLGVKMYVEGPAKVKMFFKPLKWGLYLNNETIISNSFETKTVLISTLGVKIPLTLDSGSMDGIYGLIDV